MGGKKNAARVESFRVVMLNAPSSLKHKEVMMPVAELEDTEGLTRNLAQGSAWAPVCTWYTLGNCRNGKECRYIHPKWDLVQRYDWVGVAPHCEPDVRERIAARHVDGFASGAQPTPASAAGATAASGGKPAAATSPTSPMKPLAAPEQLLKVMRSLWLRGDQQPSRSDIAHEWVQTFSMKDKALRSSTIDAAVAKKVLRQLGTGNDTCYELTDPPTDPDASTDSVAAAEPSEETKRREAYRKRLEAYFTKYDSKRLAELDDIVVQTIERESAYMKELCAKYGPEHDEDLVAKAPKSKGGAKNAWGVPAASGPAAATAEARPSLGDAPRAPSTPGAWGKTTVWGGATSAAAARAALDDAPALEGVAPAPSPTAPQKAVAAPSSSAPALTAAEKLKARQAAPPSSMSQSAAAGRAPAAGKAPVTSAPQKAAPPARAVSSEKTLAKRPPGAAPTAKAPAHQQTPAAVPAKQQQRDYEEPDEQDDVEEEEEEVEESPQEDEAGDDESVTEVEEEEEPAVATSAAQPQPAELPPAALTSATAAPAPVSIWGASDASAPQASGQLAPAQGGQFAFAEGGASSGSGGADLFGGGGAGGGGLFGGGAFGAFGAPSGASAGGAAPAPTTDAWNPLFGGDATASSATVASDGFFAGTGTDAKTKAAPRELVHELAPANPWGAPAPRVPDGPTIPSVASLAAAPPAAATVSSHHSTPTASGAPGPVVATPTTAGPELQKGFEAFLATTVQDAANPITVRLRDAVSAMQCRADVSVPRDSYKVLRSAAQSAKCALCDELLVEPVRLVRCQHHACRACLLLSVLDKESDQLPSCPSCREPIVNVEPAHSVIVEVCEDADVECKRCAWQGKRSKLTMHDCDVTRKRLSIACEKADAFVRDGNFGSCVNVCDDAFANVNTFTLVGASRECAVKLLLLDLEARMKLQHGDWESKCSLRIDTARKLAPNNASVLEWEGRVHEKMNRRQLAITAFERCLAIDPRRSEVELRLSHLKGSVSPPFPGAPPPPVPGYGGGPPVVALPAYAMPAAPAHRGRGGYGGGAYRGMPPQHHHHHHHHHHHGGHHAHHAVVMPHHHHGHHHHHHHHRANYGGAPMPPGYGGGYAGGRGGGGNYYAP